MSTTKKPDVKAPRCRKNVLTTINMEMFKEFKEKYPKYKNLSYNDFKSVIKHHSGEIWQTVINTRDGVKLPENLGILVGASCTKRTTTAYKSYSTTYGEKNQLNLNTDGYLGKIFYTNYTEKGVLKDRTLWGFTPIRQFKRTFSANYENNWSKYLLLTPADNISKLFAKVFRYEYEKKPEVKDVFDFDTYNEFEF